MGNTPPKIFLSCFLNMKISLQPVNQFDWNLANLLADSFLTNRVRIFISLFVYSKLEYFFTGSASDSLSLSLTAYNKRKSALDKNLRHGVLVKRFSVKIVTYHFLVIVIYFEQISSVWGTPWLVPTSMTPSHYNSPLRFLILLRDPL